MDGMGSLEDFLNSDDLGSGISAHSSAPVSAAQLSKGACRLQHRHLQRKREVETGLAEIRSVMSDAVDQLRREMNELKLELSAEIVTAMTQLRQEFHSGLEGLTVVKHTEELEKFGERLDVLSSDVLRLQESELGA